VVRISDSIAYLGRDMEDAISANLMTKDDLQKTCANTSDKPTARSLIIWFMT
jgi:dGTP triphosphohydrolase